MIKVECKGLYISWMCYPNETNYTASTEGEALAKQKYIVHFFIFFSNGSLYFTFMFEETYKCVVASCSFDMYNPNSIVVSKTM